ncbi:MAG: toxin-activating lysine-acyltransferase [Nitrosomonas sp.]|nr:MAG: toxin-activating lysine-acyltransferase [Nitrosomonas sp.]
MPGKIPGDPIDASKIRLITGIHPAHALGLTVGYLMTKPAFARLPFGHWSRVLVGQINRGHYLIAASGDRVVGFIGWALTTLEKGELWLAGKGELAFEDSKAGEIFLVNAWAAESHAVTVVMLKHLRAVARDHKMIYFKRFYPDGRVRPGRLRVNAFVNAHIRATQSDE